MLSKRVVMGVGPRARRYDLRFPRLRPVYVDDGADAQRMARVYRVAGAVVTGDALGEVVQCVAGLRQAVPEACIAVIDRRFVAAGDVLREAGATIVAASWGDVLQSIGQALRRAKPAKPTSGLTPVIVSRRLH